MNVSIECICPPKGDDVRHPKGDTITLRPRLDFRAAATIRNEIALMYLADEDASDAELLAVMTENYLLFGIEAWSLVDDKGAKVEASRSEIRKRLEVLGSTFVQPIESPPKSIADKADELYSEQVMLPLMLRGQKSSPPSPIDGSTSPPTASSEKPRKPSKRSSITTIPTAVTETTSSSLAIDSSSSQSSTSAA